MHFKIATYGAVFSTRSRGARVLEDLLTAVEEAADDHVVIDFAGVRTTTYSFIDEFVGELKSRVEDDVIDVEIVLENANADVYRVIGKSLRNRGLASDLVPA